MSADFAIANFRFLEPLLLVHGRWTHLRLARMINFFIYKNFMFGLTLFVYNAATLFTGQPLYNGFDMTCFNILFTSLPPIAVGAFDQDIPRHVATSYPSLYNHCSSNSAFGPEAWLQWALAGVYQCMFTMFAAYYTVRNSADRSGGMVYGHWQTGVMVYTALLNTLLLQLAVVVESWTMVHVLCIWGSVGIWFLYQFICGALPVSISGAMHHLFQSVVITSPQFWIFIFIVPLINVLPSFVYAQMQKVQYPSDVEILDARAKLSCQEGPAQDEEAPLTKGIGEAISQHGSFTQTSYSGYVPDVSELDELRQVSSLYVQNPVLSFTEQNMKKHLQKRRVQI